MSVIQCLVVIALLMACHSSAANNPPEKPTKIIGGLPASFLVPYQVSIQFLVDYRWQHICGGSIISHRHVLTAGHCLPDIPPSRLSIVVGTNSLLFGGYRHYVSAYKVHPAYAQKSYIINDLAIIKVDVPFQLDSVTVDTISLSGDTSDDIEDDFPVLLTGWGSLSPTNHTNIPDSLMYLEYDTIPNSECNMKGYSISSNQVCAFKEKNKGACVGDSGGPLVNRERTVQIGVVSYGTINCATGYPDVFTRVSNFIQWIQGVVQTELA